MLRTAYLYCLLLLPVCICQPGLYCPHLHVPTRPVLPTCMCQPGLYSGDSGAAAVALLSKPYGLALDGATGDLYVTDIDRYGVYCRMCTAEDLYC